MTGSAVRREPEPRPAAPVPAALRNPYIAPLWVACVLAIAVSCAVDIPLGTLWGLLAWIPYAVLLVAANVRTRRIRRALDGEP